MLEGEGWGKGIIREFGIDRYTLLYLKSVTNKDLLYSTWSSAQPFVAAWMRGVGGRMDIHIGMAEALHCSPETITTLLIGLLQYKIKSFFLKRNNICKPLFPAVGSLEYILAVRQVPQSWWESSEPRTCREFPQRGPESP